MPRYFNLDPLVNCPVLLATSLARLQAISILNLTVATTTTTTTRVFICPFWGARDKPYIIPHMHSVPTNDIKVYNMQRHTLVKDKEEEVTTIM